MTKPLNKVKILCVDDDPFIRKLLSHLLERQGFAIRTASNGQEGVDIARMWLPSLILMDLMMPVMDGFQASTALRSDPKTQHIPIIALTAMQGADVQECVKEIGINSLLTKPCPSEELFVTIPTHLLVQA